jgi:hypothetical protein
MTDIFPELAHSTDIYFVLPSKKSLRRFPCVDILPRPLPTTLHAHRLLPDRVHRNVVEIADLALRRVPQQAIALDQYFKANVNKKSTCEWPMTHHFNDREARLAFIREALPYHGSSSNIKNAKVGRPSNYTSSKCISDVDDNDRLQSDKLPTSNTNKPDSFVVQSTPRFNTADGNSNQLPFKIRTSRERFSIKLTWIKR